MEMFVCMYSTVQYNTEEREWGNRNRKIVG
jgi:hypothetical protein